MIWGVSNIGSISALPASTWILGFNEPNHGEQANISPSYAACIFYFFLYILLT